MDVPLLIRQRLEELHLEQKHLAQAAGVTDSYVSQLLSGKKLPPAPERSDIYTKMERFLNLSRGSLSELAGHQRNENVKRMLGKVPPPLYKGVRDLILRKCVPEKTNEIRDLFEGRPFGDLERLVTQKLLDVAKKVAKEELESDNWVHLVARMSGRSYEEMRVAMLDFLDTDIFNISADNCVSFLEPLIESWDIDLPTFAIEIVLNKRLAPGDPKRFEFVEKESGDAQREEPGFQEFLQNELFSGNATPDEIGFLKKLKFRGRRPTAIYYYRELQNLRDPLHFREISIAPMQKHREAGVIEKQMQLHARQRAMKRWSTKKK